MAKPICGRSLDTNAPRPCWLDSIPSAFSRDTASRTTVRLTSRSCASVVSDGSIDPTGQAPLTTLCRNTSVT